MKILGQPVVLSIAAALLLLLAISHPLAWLQARDVNPRGQRQPDPSSRYVAMLSGSEPLRKALAGHEVIGYATQSEIDVRTDGGGQVFYYLAQYALAPVLVELESSGEAVTQERDLVLAVFPQAEQLREYLAQNTRSVVVSLNANIALTRAREP
jgi:hypothetical protein